MEQHHDQTYFYENYILPFMPVFDNGFSFTKKSSSTKKSNNKRYWLNTVTGRSILYVQVLDASENCILIKSSPISYALKPEFPIPFKYLSIIK